MSSVATVGPYRCTTRSDVRETSLPGKRDSMACMTSGRARWEHRSWGRWKRNRLAHRHRWSVSPSGGESRHWGDGAFCGRRRARAAREVQRHPVGGCCPRRDAVHRRQSKRPSETDRNGWRDHDGRWKWVCRSVLCRRRASASAQHEPDRADHRSRRFALRRGPEQESSVHPQRRHSEPSGQRGWIRDLNDGLVVICAR